ncbi:hypothetical protein O181_067320, partial [Austropuccinia psidii MF-1]|nr:hypothetical protein [Austropuccinia psidii MF-1]
GWTTTSSITTTTNNLIDLTSSSNHLNNPSTIKDRLINLISAVRTLMRIPLIGLNILVIIYELILG